MAFAEGLRLGECFLKESPMTRKKAVPSTNSLGAGIEQFKHELKVETERGKALVGAAFLDEALEVLIRAYLVDDKECLARLVGRDGLSASFGSRILLASSLGIIDDDTRHDLDLIRKIRNEFAHRHGPSRFDQAGRSGLDMQFRWIQRASVRDECEHFEAVVWVLVGWLSSLVKLIERPAVVDFPGPPRIAAQLIEQARKKQAKIVERIFSGN